MEINSKKSDVKIQFLDTLFDGGTKESYLLMKEETLKDQDHKTEGFLAQNLSMIVLTLMFVPFIVLSFFVLNSLQVQITIIFCLVVVLVWLAYESWEQIYSMLCNIPAFEKILKGKKENEDDSDDYLYFLMSH